MERLTVTESNITDAREECAALDQAYQLIPGCITWGFVGECGQRGQISLWPNGRAAIAWGCDSEWGEYDENAGTITLDNSPDSHQHRYNFAGQFIGVTNWTQS